MQNEWSRKPGNHSRTGDFRLEPPKPFDTPVIFAGLPPRWRRCVAPAMWKEYFDAHFHPERYTLITRLANSALYRLITILFNGFPVPQTETGARESIRYMGELAEEGWSILIFPEGERTKTGEIGQFFPGIGMIASRLHSPSCRFGCWESTVCSAACEMAAPGPVEVRIGAPLSVQGVLS